MKKNLIMSAGCDDLENTPEVNVFLIPVSILPIEAMAVEIEKLRPLFADTESGLVRMGMAYQFHGGEWIDHEDEDELDTVVFADGPCVIMDREIDGQEVGTECGVFNIFINADGEALIAFEAWTNSIRFYTAQSVSFETLRQAYNEIPANPA